ncbi:hypothetical protein EIMP300_86040 [Escherichia coli]|uniref:IS66 family insertion sequence element accessory protein TnpB n=1 Tax=Escherichia coli TaxID=562 RepID=A0A8S0G2J7_ECOLX|nr:hypothetical protein EIMP300_86040 [Escherichia coli]
MISLPSGTRIWLVAGVTDMRKSFNGLGEQVQHVLNDNPFSGHLFIFRGRRGDTVKGIIGQRSLQWAGRRSSGSPPVATVAPSSSVTGTPSP